MYYKGQAISLLARVFAERGEMEEAQKWAGKSISVFNSREIIEVHIDKGKDLIRDVAFCTYWFLEELFFFACRIYGDTNTGSSDNYKQNCFETVAKIYETVYQNDDAGYEQLQHLYILHQGIAEFEATKHGDEDTIKYHLERALECCRKSTMVKEHKLCHPMLDGLLVYNAPSDKQSNIRGFSVRLEQSAYDPYRREAWFSEIEAYTAVLMKERPQALPS